MKRQALIFIKLCWSNTKTNITYRHQDTHWEGNMVLSARIKQVCKYIFIMFIVVVIALNFMNYTTLSRQKSLTKTANCHKIRTGFNINQCPNNTTYLESRINVTLSPVPTVKELERKFCWLHQGGHSYPETCKPAQKIAIIVPLYNRPDQLLLFLQHIHPFLTKQLQDYTIFVVEQYGNDTFNKGIIMNAGFLEISKLHDFDCYIFHDVDMLPENYNHTYRCADSPNHLGVLIDTMDYKIMYTTLVGGVLAFRKEHFIKVNGYSNMFWGWGGEDDNMYARIMYHNFTVSRADKNIATYTMIKHAQEKPNPIRHALLKENSAAHFVDGLSDVNYTVRQVDINLLYYRILVEFRRNATN